MQNLKNALERILQSPESTVEGISNTIDKGIHKGVIETLDGSQILKQKHKSKLDIRNTTKDLAFIRLYSYIKNLTTSNDGIPEYGDSSRDEYLNNFWRQEPILAGAVYSMAAKMTALRWSVTGRKNLATHAAKLLARAMYSINGNDWGGFIASTAQDFYTTDRGVFWETPKAGSKLLGKLQELAHIDSLNCTLTGNSKYPMIYQSQVTGQQLKFRPGEFIHFTSMPSPREKDLGIGFCAVSRAYKAAKLLIGLHDYDAEKLANLPPEGIAAITGLTKDEFRDAIDLWNAKRESKNSLTYPQVLWLIGSQPNSQVSVQFAGFSQIPESFDRNDVITQYVNTLALAFGVDAREFWPVSTSSLGTAAESEIQHMKAKGKGPGEFISIVERRINGELPEGVNFGFDTQDIEEDASAAAVAKAWIDAYMPLTKAGGALEDIISKEDFMRLLADKAVLPDYMVHDDRIAVDDDDVHIKSYHASEVGKYVWNNGILKEVAMHPI